MSKSNCENKLYALAKQTKTERSVNKSENMKIIKKYCYPLRVLSLREERWYSDKKNLKILQNFCQVQVQ